MQLQKAADDRVCIKIDGKTQGYYAKNAQGFWYFSPANTRTFNCKALRKIAEGLSGLNIQGEANL